MRKDVSDESGSGREREEWHGSRILPIFFSYSFKIEYKYVLQVEKNVFHLYGMSMKNGFVCIAATNVLCGNEYECIYIFPESNGILRLGNGVHVSVVMVEYEIYTIERKKDASENKYNVRRDSQTQNGQSKKQ